MSLDLSTIDPVADSEAGAWLHLKDPRNGEKLYSDGESVRLHVLGPMSKAVQKATEEVSKERKKREAERNEYDAKGDITKRGESTPEELKADDVKIYVAATTAWENLAFDGKDKFSKSVIEKLYTEREWAGRQVFHWMLNQENFIRGRESA